MDRTWRRRWLAGMGLIPVLLAGCNLSEDRPTAEREAAEAMVPAGIDKEGQEPGEAYRVLNLARSRQGDMLRRDVVVDMDRSGRFYLKAWAESPLGADWTVYVDGRRSENLVLHVEPGSWGYAELRRKDGEAAAVELSAGRHTLSFEAPGPVVPALENLWMSETGLPKVPDNGYAEYLRRLQISGGQGSADPQALAKTADASLATYAYGNVFASYTWTTTLYLTANTGYQFKTSTLSPAATCDPAMYLFHDSDPNQFSKRSWDDVDRNPWIGGPVPTTGYYRLLIVAENSSSQGTATVLMDGSPIATQCAVAGTFVPVWQATQSGEQNYFTAKLEHDHRKPYPDTRLFLISDHVSGSRVRMHNDDFLGGGTYGWGQLSRIRATIGTSIAEMIVSTYSSASTGYTQYYGKVHSLRLTSDWTIAFPNLNALDAMQSAPATPRDRPGFYNCHAYAGGMTSSWQEPHNSGNPWYVSGNPVASFDNFYANRCATGGTCSRYNGAWSYTRTNANEHNASLAIWAPTNWPTDIKHSSVRSQSNNHPHGYDWESKCGSLARIFHPRDALRNESSYGVIQHYYTSPLLAKVSAGSSVAAKAEPIDEAASIRLGLSKLEPRETLQASHKQKIQALKSASRTFEGEFSALYEAWKGNWNSPAVAFSSNSAAFKELPGYQALLGYCRANRAASMAVLTEKLEAGDDLAKLALGDLALPAFQAKLDEEVAAWRERGVDSEGRMTVFSSENTWLRFAKRVLIEDL